MGFRVILGVFIKTNLDNVTRGYTAAGLLGVILFCSGAVFGQGSLGPDTKGPAIGVVTPDTPLVSALVKVQGQCLANIVDELVNTVSQGEIRVKASSVPNAQYFDHVTNYGELRFEVQVKTTYDCSFQIVQDRFHEVAGVFYGSRFQIVGDLNSCPKAFPDIRNRYVNLWYRDMRKSVESHAYFDFTPEIIYRLDSFGGIEDQKKYALNPSVQGRNNNPIDFKGEMETVVFSYSASKFRECMVRGLSDLAKP